MAGSSYLCHRPHPFPLSSIPSLRPNPFSCSFRTMLLKCAHLLFLVSLCLTVDLTYRVQEEKSPGTYIGDIAADTHLMDSVPQQDRRLIRFSLLEPDVPDVPQLFRVAKKTASFIQPRHSMLSHYAFTIPSVTELSTWLCDESTPSFEF